MGTPLEDFWQPGMYGYLRAWIPQYHQQAWVKVEILYRHSDNERCDVLLPTGATLTVKLKALSWVRENTELN